MEDEIASIAAVIGASWTGKKAMTATSGPGFSLMMENLGFAVMNLRLRSWSSWRTSTSRKTPRLDCGVVVR